MWITKVDPFDENGEVIATPREYPSSFLNAINQGRMDVQKEVNQKKEKQHNGAEISSLKESLNESSSSLFLKKLENNEEMQEVFQAISEKQQEYKSRVNIEEYKELMPNAYKLELPILIRDIDGQMQEYCKNFDKALWELSPQRIEEIKKLITIIDIGWNSLWAFPTDFSITMLPLSGYENSSTVINWFFLHELTHIKQYLMVFNDKNFWNNLSNFQQGSLSTKTVIPMFAERPYRDGQFLKVNERTGEEEDYTLTTVFHSWEIFKVDPMNNKVEYIDKNGITKSIDYKEARMLARRLVPEFPKGWFIIPYSKGGSLSEALLFDKREIHDSHPEELTTILEKYYANRDYFEEAMIYDKDSNIIPLNEQYDEQALYPLLRKKLRMMIEYGFFPEGEMDKYFSQ